MKNVKQERYVIFWNLTGLHPPYTCRSKKGVDGQIEWWDKSGNTDYDPLHPVDIKEGYGSVGFKSKAQAMEVYEILKAFRDHVKRHL